MRSFGCAYYVCDLCSKRRPMVFVQWPSACTMYGKATVQQLRSSASPSSPNNRAFTQMVGSQMRPRSPRPYYKRPPLPASALCTQLAACSPASPFQDAATLASLFHWAIPGRASSKDMALKQSQAHPYSLHSPPDARCQHPRCHESRSAFLTRKNHVHCNRRDDAIGRARSNLFA